MKYLIMSVNGLSLFMIRSLGMRTDVDKIYFYCMDRKQKDLGKDLNLLKGWEKLEIVQDGFKIINETPKNDLIIVDDDVGIGSICDVLRKDGYTVIGGTEFTDRLENDRTFGTDFFSRVMKVPESYTFSSFSDGIGWLKMQPKEDRFVFKPHDGDVPKDMTYVSKDVQDMLQTIDTYRSDWKWGEEFQLQRYVEGILVDFGAWFNGEEWLQDSHYLYFEDKPFLTGNKGPATGGEVAVVIYRKNEGPFMDILNKITPALKKVKYSGQISVNSIVYEKDKQPYFLELTPRFGYPSLPQDLTALEDNDKYAHDLFKVLAEKEQKSLFQLNKSIVVLVVSTPPYPNDDVMHVSRELPFSWDKKYDEYFFPYTFMYDKKKKSMVFTGDQSPMINVTCVDVTIDGAKAMLYDNYISSMHLKNMQYRIDAGDDAKKRIKTLHEWGLI